MECSLKLPKKNLAEWRARNFSSRGTADGPAGVGLSSRALLLSSRATRVVERTLARPLVHGIACAPLKSIPIDPSRDALLHVPFLPRLARSHARSFALAPFRRGRAIAQDPRRLRRGPHCAAVVVGLRCRPFDRPTDRAPFPVLKPLTH